MTSAARGSCVGSLKEVNRVPSPAGPATNQNSPVDSESPATSWTPYSRSRA